MVSFDADSNCVEALNVSGYVDVYIDGGFYSRCNFTKAVRVCLVLNSDKTGSNNLADGVVSRYPSLTNFKNVESVPAETESYQDARELLANPTPEFGLSGSSGPEPGTSEGDCSRLPSCTLRIEGMGSCKEEVVLSNRMRGVLEMSNVDDGYSNESQLKEQEECFERRIASVRPENGNMGCPTEDQGDFSVAWESESDELKCDICEKTFERRRQMLTHGRNPDCVVNCSVCSKKFLSKVLYFVHFCKRHPDINAKSYFQEVANVAHPINWCVDGEIATCPICLEEEKKMDLMNHLETIHFRDPSFICCVCNKSFSSEREWHQHSRSHREDQDGVSGDDSETEIEDSHEDIAPLTTTKHEPPDYSDEMAVTDLSSKDDYTSIIPYDKSSACSNQTAKSSEDPTVSNNRNLSKRVASESEQTSDVSYNVISKEDSMEEEFSAAENEEDEGSDLEESDNDSVAKPESYNVLHKDDDEREEAVMKREGNEKPEKSLARPVRQKKSCNRKNEPKKGNFRCDFCGQRFTTVRDRNAHRLNANHTETCKLCGSTHSSKGSLFQHYCKVHSDVEDLKEQFGHELSLVNLKILTKQGVCPLCMAPLSEEDWGKHFDILHFTNPLYSCCVCGQEFNTETMWYDHCCEEHGKLTSTNSRGGLKWGKRLEKGLANISFTTVDGPGGSQLLQCKYCQKTFSSKMLLLAHLKRKTVKTASIPCKQCKSRFKDQATLMAHERRRHREDQASRPRGKNRDKHIDCPVCYKVVRNSDLIFHIRKWHTNETIFACCLCGEGCPSLTSYKTHCRIKHTDKPDCIYQCSLCDQTFSCNSEFGRHKAGHRRMCTFCGETFPLIKLTQKHYEEVHPEQLFTCSHCGKKFASLKSLQTHERHLRFHPVEPCPKCGLMYRNMKKHLRTVHSEDQEVQCSVCGKTLKNNFRLKRHMQDLHRSVQLSCPECAKVFTNEKAYTRHLTHVHFVGKSHTCHVCGKSFPRKTTLKYHERIHSATKMFICPMCGQGFNYKVSLLTHAKSKHPGYELSF